MENQLEKTMDNNEETGDMEGRLGGNETPVWAEVPYTSECLVI